MIGDSHILNLVNPLVASLGATLGTVNLQFNRSTNFSPVPMTGDLTLALFGSGNIEGVQLVIPIDGNYTNNLILPANSVGWYDIKGLLFDNTKRNIYTFYFIAGSVLYSNNRVPLPVVPGIPVYILQNIASIGPTSAAFNVQINKTGTVKWMITTSATPPTKAQILAGTGAVGGNFGSTSVTVRVTSLIPFTGLMASTSYYLHTYAIDLTADESAIQTAINFSTTVSAIVAQDTFTGADTSNILASLRVTPIGGFAWNVGGSGTLGIVSNTLKLTSSGGTTSYGFFAPGKRDVDVSVVVSNIGTSKNNLIWIAFQDGQNLIQVDEYCGVTQTASNVTTTLITGIVANAWANGDTIRVILNGVNISIYKNGTLLNTSSNVSASLTSQNVGFYIQENSAAFSSITVY